MRREYNSNYKWKTSKHTHSIIHVNEEKVNSFETQNEGTCEQDIARDICAPQYLPLKILDLDRIKTKQADRGSCEAK